MTVNATMTRARRLATIAARRILIGRVPKLFDREYYLRSNPEVVASGIDPYLHYIWFGVPLGLDPADDFDTKFYRDQSGSTRLDPIRHYIKQGVKAGLDPNPKFNTSAYLMRYPDVAATGANPLLHYRTHGRREGREASPVAATTEQIVPIRGVQVRHILNFPIEDGKIFEIHLRSDISIQGDWEPVKRMCFLLKLTNEEIILVLHAFQSEGLELARNIILEMAVKAEPKSSLNTLLIAFEHCYTTKKISKGLVRLRYGEAHLWDLRKPMPSVIEIFGPGAAEFRCSSDARSSA